MGPLTRVCCSYTISIWKPKDILLHQSVCRVFIYIENNIQGLSISFLLSHVFICIQPFLIIAGIGPPLIRGVSGHRLPCWPTAG